MSKKWLLSLLSILLLSTNVTAQQELSIAEVQGFFKLIKQTKEYKRQQTIVDSFNTSIGSNGVPQELDIQIKKRDESAANDDYIFEAWVERKLEVGFGLEKYLFKYHKQKKQIVSVELQYKRNMN